MAFITQGYSTDNGTPALIRMSGTTSITAAIFGPLLPAQGQFQVAATGSRRKKVGIRARYVTLTREAGAVAGRTVLISVRIPIPSLNIWVGIQIGTEVQHDGQAYRVTSKTAEDR